MNNIKKTIYDKQFIIPHWFIYNLDGDERISIFLSNLKYASFTDIMTMGIILKTADIIKELTMKTLKNKHIPKQLRGK